jgi:hypothetical protein
MLSLRGFRRNAEMSPAFRPAVPGSGVPTITYHGRKAWQIESELTRVIILECGGHGAEIASKLACNLNPLGIQNRTTIDSDQFAPAIHGPIYGADAEARLISGLLGHDLCFPYWGSPSVAEAAAGMTFHGESNILRWESVLSLDWVPHPGAQGMAGF